MTQRFQRDIRRNKRDPEPRRVRTQTRAFQESSQPSHTQPGSQIIGTSSWKSRGLYCARTGKSIIKLFKHCLRQWLEAGSCWKHRCCDFSHRHAYTSPWSKDVRPDAVVQILMIVSGMLHDVPEGKGQPNNNTTSANEPRNSTLHFKTFWTEHQRTTSGGCLRHTS